MTNTIAATTALLLLISLLISASSAAEAPPPVLDIEGKPLRSNTDYYILPVFRGRGGGLTLTAATNISACPLAVAQAGSEVDRGLPVTFTPVDPKKGVIRESTDLNVKFSVFTICFGTTVWQVAGPDEATGNYFVAVDGQEGNPGPETLSNWFKIEKNGRGYNLRFCPTVCNFCKVICSDVGVYVDGEGKRRLVLSDVPFLVVFRKASLGNSGLSLSLHGLFFFEGNPCTD